MPPKPSSASGGRPRDAAIDTRVLAAARQLLTARGLRGMSLDAVAEAAGVARSTIYRRWSSSDELVLDVLDDALGQLPGPDPSVAADAFWSDLRDSLRVAIEGLSNPIERDAIQLWLGRLTHQPKLHRRYWEKRVRPRRERAIQSLQAAADTGSVRPDADAGLLVDMLAGLILYRYFLTPPELRGEETDEQWVERVLGLAENLLEPRRRKPRP